MKPRAQKSRKTLQRMSGVFVAFLILISSVSGQIDAIETKTNLEVLFDQAAKAVKKKDYKTALAKFEEILKHEPNATGALYNGGLTAFLLGDFESAAKHWQRLKRLEPEDWQVRAKLIQTYQSLGNTEKRDVERKELFHLREQRTVDSLNLAEFYCREQSEFGGRKVMVFEHFVLIGPRALKYVFYVLNDAGKIDYRISLGSYDMTNAIWQDTSGKGKKDKDGKPLRLFHLDGYYDWGHATLGMFPGAPDYDRTRDLVKKVIIRNEEQKRMKKKSEKKPDPKKKSKEMNPDN